MRLFLISLLILCMAGIGWADGKIGNEKYVAIYGDLFTNSYNEITMFVDTNTGKVYYPAKNVRQDTFDKMYSMFADLHIKFMGEKRYNQIYDPNNDGEVEKQKRHNEYIQKVIKGEILQDE